MTSIALLWSPRKDIRSTDFFRAMTCGTSGPASVLFWDGGERLVVASDQDSKHSDSASETWVLALGLCGASSLAPASAPAPAWNPDAGQALALAGNVRNTDTLSGEPLRKAVKADQEQDGLLGLLLRKGTAALQELSGEWALALLQHLEKRLTLCCDRAGGEALYYQESPQRFAAASRPGVALTLAGLPALPDREWALACLASGSRILPDSGATAYAGLQRLRPGGVLQVTEKQGTLRTDLLRFSLLESFVDLPVDASRIHQDMLQAATLRLPASGGLGLAWTGGPGAAMVAALAVELLQQQAPQTRVALYALEQSGRACSAPTVVAKALDIPLISVPWPEHAELEARRAALVQRTGLPLTDPFSALEMDLLCKAMRANGLTSAWAGCGARSLLGISAPYAQQAMRALARKRHLLPALVLRRALAPTEAGPARRLADQLGFLLQSLAPRPYRSTQEQARIELLAHYAPDLNRPRLLEFYKQSFNWRELTSLRRMQLQQLTRGDGPARIAALRLAAANHGLDLALPLLDQHLARYLRLPLSARLAQGRACPLLLQCLPPKLAQALREQEPHAPVEHLAALPLRHDPTLEASPLLNTLFPNLPALLADLRAHHGDERFQELPALLDALVEWEQVCGIIEE
ncbi:MAG: asparagine synthase-related protein [Desulfovibrio sp.]